jgi:hypothetical protein
VALEWGRPYKFKDAMRMTVRSEIPADR